MQTLAFLLAALAQTGAPQGLEIVVTGERPSEEAAVRDFVRDVGVETAEGQLARLEGAICPHVVGLADAHNRYIAGTVTAVAEAVGADRADQDCDINLVVIVNSEPGALIQMLRTRQPFLFEALDPPQRDRLIEGDAPVRVWSALDIRGSDGRPMTRIPNEGPPFFRSLAILDGVLPTRILRSTRVDLATTFIVLDAGQIEGLTLQQISGYVAMLALAQVETERPIKPDRSILNLFHDRASPPDDLTSWDIAYLRALYASDNRRSAVAQRGQMGRMIGEALATDED